MLVFGVDIPLIEVLLVLVVIIFILLVESLVLIGMLISQMNKTKKTLELMQKMADTLLAIKKAEVDALERIRRK